MGVTQVLVTLRVPGTSPSGYTAPFLVDTGATDSMAPTDELVKAGIKPVGRKRYELADGSVQEYVFGLAEIEFMGEVTAGRVIFGPPEVPPILGVTALESAGIVVDSVNGTLRRLPAIWLKSQNSRPAGVCSTRSACNPSLLVCLRTPEPAALL